MINPGQGIGDVEPKPSGIDEDTLKIIEERRAAVKASYAVDRAAADRLRDKAYQLLRAYDHATNSLNPDYPWWNARSHDMRWLMSPENWFLLTRITKPSDIDYASETYQERRWMSMRVQLGLDLAQDDLQIVMGPNHPALKIR
jgi:hypothetical protein